MSGEALLGLQATHNPHRFVLPVTPRLCVGPAEAQFLFGGAGLASALAALEAATGRPPVWAAAQYLSYARPPAMLDLDVVVPVAGHQVSQARVTGHVADREILTVNAALGVRPSPVSHQWAQAPSVPPPDDCMAMPLWPRRHPDDVNALLDIRVAAGRYGPARDGSVSPDGHAVLWARPAAGVDVPIDAAFAALVADFVPSGVGSALGLQAGGSSLDNTIRFLRPAPVETDWLLCDVRIHGVEAGFAHGRMHLFARDGALIATASQSMILRVAS